MDKKQMLEKLAELSRRLRDETECLQEMDYVFNGDYSEPMLCPAITDSRSFADVVDEARKILESHPDG